MGRLPEGFEVRLARDVRVGGRGSTVLGGMPVRLLRVHPAVSPTLRQRRFRVADARSAALAEVLLDRGLAEPHPVSDGAARRAELTVVVPVKDRAEGVARLLRTVPAEVPVIVVDDGSADAAALAAVARAAGARIHRSPVSQGPAAARNSGLALAETPFVLFADSDIELDAGSVDLLLAHFDDPRVGAVAPRIAARRADDGVDGAGRAGGAADAAVQAGGFVDGVGGAGSGTERAAAAPAGPGPRAGRDSGWLARYEAACSSLDLGPRPALVQPRGRVSYVPSACLAVRRAAVSAGFDAGMQVAEDVDLVWRLTKAGWAVRYEPGAIARHDHRTSFRAWFARRHFYGTGAALLAERHGAAVAPAVVAPWSAAVVGLLLAGGPWSAALAGLIALVTVLRIAGRLEHSERPVQDAARLAGGGIVATALQWASLITRHWWPVAVVACILSPRFRVIAAAAALVDGAWDYVARRPRLDPFRYWIARRLDDVAYGSGLWWGCLRRRHARALLPDVTRW